MPGPTGPSPRMIGLTVATLMAVVFVVIVWRSMGAGVQSTGPGMFPDDPSAIPDLSDLEQGASMFVTIVDRQDPTRVAGTLKADQFEPIGGGQRRLVNPDAWIFMRDGREVHITAQSGIVMMPDPNEAPDSGILEGDVTIKAYDPVSGSDGLEDSMGAVLGTATGVSAQRIPTMTARFDAPVEFERRYQRLISDGRFTIDSPGIEFIGHDLTVMLNEVLGRVELIDVKRGERLVFRPNAQAKGQQTHTGTPNRSKRIPPAYRLSRVSYPAAQTGTGVQAESDPNPAVSEPAEPKRTPYHIRFDENVLVEMVGTGTLQADALDIWAMLTDGALSDSAIKPITFSTPQPPKPPKVEPPKVEPSKVEPSKVAGAQSQDHTQPADSAPAGEPVQRAGASTPHQSVRKETSDRASSSASAATELGEGEILVTWDGGLVVRPIEEPDETALSTQELALSFVANEQVVFETSAQQGGEVRGGQNGVRGLAQRVNYGATSGVLELVGASEKPVEIVVEEAGTLRSEVLLADLGRGKIMVESAGLIETLTGVAMGSPSRAGQGVEPGTRIEWLDEAEFVLVQNPDGSLTNQLQSAFFAGEVLSTRADAVLKAQTFLAEFDAGVESNKSDQSTLRSVTLGRGSLVSDAGSLSGDTLAFGFQSDGAGGIELNTLSALGVVVGSSADGRVETDKLDARLTREFDGTMRVSWASAVGGTEFFGEQQTHASGHRVELDTSRDLIHIVADQDDPSQQAVAGQGGSVVNGRDIWINTRSRSIRVDGPGRFDHDIVVDGSPTGGHLQVNWDQGMRFEDATGSIECLGNVVAVSTPDMLTIDTLKADRLEIDLTAATGMGHITDPNAADSDPDQGRALLQARAYGRAVPGGDPVLANVESRQYDPENPERAIGVMYLEGAQLVADNQTQVLRVHSSGMLVLMDRTEDQPGGAVGESASVMPSTSGPGLTRMTWLGSMELDRSNGRAVVIDEVNIRHKSLTTGRVSQLECDRLDATFTAFNGSDSTGPIAMQRADASGRVRFTDLQRTLLSDYAIYDALKETLFAYADGDRLVTLRDSTNPTPVSARTLLWDLKEDLVEIDAPSPVRTLTRP